MAKRDDNEKRVQVESDPLEPVEAPDAKMLHELVANPMLVRNAPWLYQLALSLRIVRAALVRLLKDEMKRPDGEPQRYRNCYLMALHSVEMLYGTEARLFMVKHVGKPDVVD